LGGSLTVNNLSYCVTNVVCLVLLKLKMVVASFNPNAKSAPALDSVDAEPLPVFVFEHYGFNDLFHLWFL